MGNCNARNIGIGRQRIKKSVIMFIHAMNRLRSVRHFWSVCVRGLHGPAATMVIANEYPVTRTANA